MKANWRERVVMMAHYSAVIVEALLYIGSLGYLCCSLGGKVLYSDWAYSMTDEGEIEEINHYSEIFDTNHGELK